MQSLKIENTLAVTLLFMAMFQSAGFLLNNDSLFSFGKSLAFSPLPIPFREIGDIENYVVAFEIITDGKKVDEETIRQKGSNAPHRWKIAAFASIDRQFFNSGEDPIRDLLFYHVSCNKYNYYTDTKPSTVTFRYIDLRTNEPLSETTVNCDT